MPLNRAQFLACAATAFARAQTLDDLARAWARHVAGVYPWLAPELRIKLETLHARAFLALSFVLTEKGKDDMKMSAAGRALLIQREGFKTKAYKDTKGIWTIGVGHTAAAGSPFPFAGLTITKGEVDEILSRDLVAFEDCVESAVRVPLTQGQFDALVSLCFNIGGSGFRKSIVVRRLNEGNYRGAADAFLMWNKPSEIMGRRRSEYKQFLAATSKSAAGAPVRFVATEEMEEGESVSLDYLRAAGSRTVTAADKIKTGAVSIGVGDALDVASRAKGYVDQARDLAEGWDAGAPVSELLSTYSPLLLGIGAGLAIAALAYLAYRAAQHIQRARLEDALLMAEVAV
jgi:lysozyme